jgi:hypothetical protein
MTKNNALILKNCCRIFILIAACIEICSCIVARVCRPNYPAPNHTILTDSRGNFCVQLKPETGFIYVHEHIYNSYQEAVDGSWSLYRFDPQMKNKQEHHNWHSLN